MPKTAPVDPDAQAFITAAAITDPTQQSAINTLVVDLKGYNIWSKFKAIYPFCGSTASQHKWNLRDPRDLDAAFRILWIGGVTHSSNGVQFGGVNGYGDTRLNALANTTISNVSFGLYSRTNNIQAGSNGVVDSFSSNTCGISLSTKWTDNNTYYSSNNYVLDGSGNFVTDTRGLFVATKDPSLAFPSALYRNGIGIRSATPTFENRPNGNIYLGARNNLSAIPNAQFFDNKELAFAFIGNTLTATDNSNFYTAVQAFQTTLGRSIGTQTVSDADAQAFVTAANITDQVEADAINNLVIGMKADGLWTKMKAIYPIVGGSASSHKYNLKDPRDLDAAFRLTFASGWTHSSTGMTPLNTFANTFFNPNSGFSTNDNVHLSYYSRTNSNGTEIEIGSATTVGGPYLILEIRTSGTTYYIMNSSGSYATASDSDSRAFYIGNRIGTAEKGFRNNTNVISRTSTATPRPNFNTYLGAFNAGGTASTYTTKQCAFASIGDGLTDTDAANFYTLVNTYQTALSRNV